MTSSVHARVFPNSYRDSVELMRIAAEIEGLAGIERAGLVMATPANRDVLARGGLASEAAENAGPNDLIVAVSTPDPDAAIGALARAAELIAGQLRETSRHEVFHTLADATAAGQHLNLALISTPGPYATAEALKALKRGMNVFIFSDNVSIEDEIELKTLASQKGLLVMGPDCGTAILDGVPLGFANAVRRGTIGLVGASGTGLQQVSCLIDRFGGGLSQAIGTGGRDLDERVGGKMMLAGLERLAADDGTSVIVLISKPPPVVVARRILATVRDVDKAVVVNFLGGDPEAVRDAGAVPASTFEDAAAFATLIALGQPLVPFAEDRDIQPADLPARIASHLRRDQRTIRGLYTGGSLAGEAKLILETLLGSERAHEQSIVDLGDDEYTVGRPHPMIDPRLRNEQILAAASDPTTAVILLDLVLGYGSHPDPAGAVRPTIEQARMKAAQDGRQVTVIASVCGTEGDPQGLQLQEERLVEAGVTLTKSNASAARLAARILQAASVATRVVV